MSSVDRISPNDAMVLATDRGPAPMHIGAVLVLSGGPDVLDLTALRGLLAERVARVPRLRQVLAHPPLGLGRPYWLDRPAFDISAHVQQRTLGPGGERALLEAASHAMATPLERARPLWRAALLTGWDDTGADRPALLVVLHHVLADGIGGLAVLAALADTDVESVDAGAQPRAARPNRRRLLADAGREWWAAVRSLSSSAGHAAAGLRELGLARRRPRLVARTSLLRPTGPRRRYTTVDVPLADVTDAAHARGCTLNDLVLAACVGALAELLRRRGEHPTELVVSVPVSARRAAGGELGNATGVRPVAVPAQVPPVERLRAVAAATAAGRDTPRASSAAPLGATFRALARLGLFRLFVDHQRLVHTFESNVRGPSARLRLAGRDVERVVALAANPGNIGVSFLVLSYAGQLEVTVVADPAIVPEQEFLTDRLRAELDQLVACPP